MDLLEAEPMLYQVEKQGLRFAVNGRFKVIW